MNNSYTTTITLDSIPLRQLILQDLNPKGEQPTKFDLMNDELLFKYYKDRLYARAYNKGFDDCCRDNPDIDSITYLV